jgi:MraZ protein
MTQFKGTHQVRRDGKGRVSIPSAFRTVLKADHPEGGASTGALVLRPSHKYPCIEGWHPTAFAAQGGQIQLLPRFSDEEDDLALALYSDAVDAEPDKEGRIVLPRDLADHAGLGDEVAFVGAGSHFQIWEPQAALRRIAEARERARVLRMTLPPGPQPAPQGAMAAGGGK